MRILTCHEDSFGGSYYGNHEKRLHMQYPEKWLQEPNFTICFTLITSRLYKQIARSVFLYEIPLLHNGRRSVDFHKYCIKQKSCRFRRWLPYLLTPRLSHFATMSWMTFIELKRMGCETDQNSVDRAPDHPQQQHIR